MVELKYKEVEQMFKKKKKNYVTLAIIYLVVIVVVLYAASWYSTYQNYKTTIPVLRNIVSEINTEELDHFVLENPDGVVYMCVATDPACRSFDTNLKKELLKNGLQDSITYIDLQGVANKENYINSIFANYGMSSNINNTPLFLAFENGKIVSYLGEGEATKLTVEETIKFIKKYRVGI
jgi:hypothetical protein